SGHPAQVGYRLRGSRSRAATACRARPSPQDSTPMPPSGDAQPMHPLLPFTDEGNTAGRKDCRSGRALAGAGVSTSDGPARYEIRVAGVLDGRWAAWFDGLQVSGHGDETVICGLLADQSALHGLLTKVRDLGLCLISVHRLDTSQAETKDGDTW